MQPSSFKFDEDEYQHRHNRAALRDCADLGGLSHDAHSDDNDESVSAAAVALANQSFDDDDDDDDDHYFRQPPTTTQTRNDMNNDAAASTVTVVLPPPPPPPPRPQMHKNNSSHTRQQQSQRSMPSTTYSNAEYSSTSNENTAARPTTSTSQLRNKLMQPTLEPYVTRLEKFELFSTMQCYYLVACNKAMTEYRIMKMDRTLIEQRGGGNANTATVAKGGSNGSSNSPTRQGQHGKIVNTDSMHTQTMTTTWIESQGSGGDSSHHYQADESHDMGENNKTSHVEMTKGRLTKSGSTFSTRSKMDSKTKPSSPDTLGSSPTNNMQQSQPQSSQSQQGQQTKFRRLNEFLFEDPAVYTQSEIKDILDMINDGNGGGGGGGIGVDSQSQHHPHGINGGNQPHDFSVAANPSVGGVSGSNEDRSSTSAFRSTGGGHGLKPICKAYGILGFIRFLDCYYLTLITKRAKVGCIGGNSIYTIKSTETFPIKAAEWTKSASGSAPHSEAAFSSSSGLNPSYYGNDPSSMLLSMWNRGKRSVGLGLSNREIAELRYQGLYQVIDLTKNFFFSYTYDLTRSLQENFLCMTSRPFPPPPSKDMYAWNFFLTRELEECTHSITSFHWVLPVVHGAFIQRKLHDYGRSLNLILLARRSRHFAGTRYLKRGVSDRGKVANDVEHEQILHDEASFPSGVFSSYLQIRGSIPTFWTQESSAVMPKPPILINRVDPTYQATQLHFEDLLRRYGSPIIVVDLVKQSEKRNEFRNAIDYINCHVDDAHKILYCALDYSHISKHRNLNVSRSLNDVATWSVNQTGFFCSNPQWKIMKGGSIKPFYADRKGLDCSRGTGEELLLSEKLGGIFFPMEQMGILRTNCIDCLDRTNVAQFSAGVEALGHQLVVMGIRSSPKLDPSSIIVRMLIDMYVEIGDQIALQYGGSEAHKKAGTISNIPGQLGKHKELLTSIRRYYSNAFTDRLKQDSINLFLGYYLPSQHGTPLWELENDYYLHNFHVHDGHGSLQSMNAYCGDWGALANVHSSGKQLLSKNSSVGITQINSHFAWYKIALQAYIQQRMWMQLGNPSASELPPRFDRIHRPNELSHFDKVFVCPWAVPSRLSHEDQHKLSANDEELTSLTTMNTPPIDSKITLFDERVHSYKGNSELLSATEDDQGYISLQYYLDNHGLRAKNRPALSQLLEAVSNNIDKDVATAHYLGSLKEARKYSDPKYVDYATNPLPQQSFSPGKREEFSAYLNRVGVGIDSDEVQEIRKLSQSAHISQEIQSGPYRGMNENESAVRAATTIHGYFNYIEEKVEEGECSYNEIPPELLETLKQSDLYSAGFSESFYSLSRHLAKAEVSYSEIIDMSSLGYRRSDLTTESSMKLYTSFFDPSIMMSSLDEAFSMGERLPSDPTKPLRRSIRPCEKVSGVEGGLRSFDEDSFIRKAATKGIEITKKSPSCLAEFRSQHAIPHGFEQINEDLYARKDNKFMVFNWAGVESWTSPPEPVTKNSRGMDILTSLK